MTAFFAWLVRVIGIGGCAFIGLYVYDWGIPGADRIAIPQSVPLVGGFGLVDVPILGDLATGRAHTFAADQVKIATAQQRAICDGRLEKLVSVAELAAANATIERERALRRMADEAAAEADKRASNAEQAKAVSDAKVEQLLADAAKDPELTRPNQKDREWQAKH